MDKEYYWLITAVNWNCDHYDYFTVTLSTKNKAVTRESLDDCAKSMSSAKNGEKFLITQVSYLGCMTEQEFNQ